ncbi:MAG: amidase family protein, partial [Chloroflexi bacterium]|nr:amidase family protein [Chloroflexota bacterium]
MPDLSSSRVSPKTSELVFKTAREQARLVASGEVSSVELVGAHLEQIEQVNPSVNAMVTMVAESAMERARAADKARSTGKELGPLHGLPIAIKDLHD